MGFVYKIINDINNKIYIGITQQQNPYIRWKLHLSDSKRKQKENRPLYYAMQKYGQEHFHFEIIEEIEDISELIEREKYYIKKYNTYVGFKDSNGYNATLGGDGKAYIVYSDKEVINAFEESWQIELTAKKLNIDRSTVRKILERNNIHYFTGQLARDYDYYLKYYGISKIDIENQTVIDNYRSVNEIMLENPLYDRKKIYRAIDGENHHERYGYLWYRMIDLQNNTGN